METSSSMGTEKGSLLTLIETALALENDPRGEHSYALNEVDSEGRLKSKEIDHNYYFTDKKHHSSKKHVTDGSQSVQGKSVNFKIDFETHRSSQEHRNCSDEDLFMSSDSFKSSSKKPVLPQYRSKDSALDEPCFEDAASHRSLSLEKINFLSEKRIIPGTSDPDISRMTLQSDYDMEQPQSSLSLPNSPPFREGGKRFDHTYAKNEFAQMQKDDLLFQKNLFYKSTFQDHSYGTFNSTDDFVDDTQGSGIKRGRSDENINKLNNIPFTNAAFLKSPFLDHTYQSIESSRVSGQRPGFVLKRGRVCSNENLDDRSDSFFLREPSFLDHCYDKNCDNVEDIWSRARDTWARARSLSLSAGLPSKVVNQQSGFDHSYVIQNADFIKPTATSTGSIGKLSDSGTESINDDGEEDMMTSTFSDLLQLRKDHTYTTMDKLLYVQHCDGMQLYR